MIGEYPPFKISRFIPEQTLNNGKYNFRFNPLFIELKRSHLYQKKEKAAHPYEQPKIFIKFEP